MHRPQKPFFAVLAVAATSVGAGLLVIFGSRRSPAIVSLESSDGGRFRLSDVWDGVSLGGYTSKVSVMQGQSIDFHISTDTSPFTLTVWREGATRQLMATVANVIAAQHDCAGGYQPPGCGWPSAYTLVVPTTWPSGVYTVDSPTAAAGMQHWVFWVREDQPGSTSSMLFLSAVNTYHAYNNFGGKSLYNSQSSDGQKASKVSFNRPFQSNGLGQIDLERGVFEWMENEGYAVEYAAESDLQALPTLLDPYDVVIFAGHSEYWSWDMRQRLKAFIAGGGRLINLSGNNMWWQVRYEDAGRTLVGYKDYLLDPAETPQEETDNTWDYPINDAEYAITGAHWRSGGYFNVNTFKYADGYGGFWIQRPEHWVFNGTGLSVGDVLGRGPTSSTSVVGVESDGTSYNCAVDGRTILGPLANTGTPHNFTILGIAPVALQDKAGAENRDDIGFAVMGIYTSSGGGAVFSGNTTGWQLAMGNAQVEQVTRNVFDRFLANDFPAEPPAGSDTDYWFYDRFNCDNLDHNGVLPTYTGPAWYAGVPGHNYVFPSGTSSLRYTDACGIGEGSGLEATLSISSPFELQSQVKPNWQSADVLYTRLYVNLTALTMAEYDQFTLMKQVYDPRSSAASSQAELRLRRQNGKTSVRFVDSQTDQGTAWVEVSASQTFVLETMWSKPGNLLTLWLDSVRYDQALDLATRQPMNRVDLGLFGLDAGSAGSICLDEFAFDVERIGPLGGVHPPDVHKMYLPLLVRSMLSANEDR